MPRLAIGPLDVHYLREGRRDGQPLLLLAGMASDSASWQPVLPGLGNHFDLIVPDNRCSGQTRPSPVACSRQLLVDDVIALLDALELERVSLLGHSMGAMLGWSLASLYPERITALVAMSALPEVSPARVDYFQTMARLREQCDSADWTRLLLHALFSPRFLSDAAQLDAAVAGAIAYPHRQSNEALSAQAQALTTFLAPVDISTVRCPVLALTGELDAMASPDALHARFEEVPSIEPVIIPQAAHPVHWEQPEQVIETVQSFLLANSA